MIELTPQQHEALAGGETSVLDTATDETYVLIRKGVYARLKSLIALDEYDPDKGFAYVNEIVVEDDAGDPLLDSYRDYAKGTLCGPAT